MPAGGCVIPPRWMRWLGLSGWLDPRAMPLTGLANAAIDRVAPDPAAFAAGLLALSTSLTLAQTATSTPAESASKADSTSAA